MQLQSGERMQRLIGRFDAIRWPMIVDTADVFIAVVLRRKGATAFFINPLKIKIMRTNNEQKINELKRISEEIISKSKSVVDYDIETQVEDDELFVSVALVNEDGVVVWDSEGTYFEVWCALELVLYPLL